MDAAQFDSIWSDIQTETNNRKTGAFKRALWYGNNSSIIGQNKGLRKAIRNAPKTVAMVGVGAGMNAVQIPSGLSDAISAVADTVLSRGKDMYSAQVKPHIKSKQSPSAEEALRKSVKNSVKDLKGNAFQVIDRNLVKLKDAKNKVSPAVQEMMQSQSHMSYAHVSSNLEVPTNEKQLQKAHDALRSVAETQYYTDKLIALVTSTETALSKIKTDLEAIKIAAEKGQTDVAQYVKEYL
jgi:hypothetical protein